MNSSPPGPLSVSGLSAAMEARLVKVQCRNLSLDVWKAKRSSLKNYLIHTAVRWKLLQAQWSVVRKCSTGPPLVHLVKGGETLTSISRRYGVSMLEIAAENDNIVNIDIIFEGERLNIPICSEKLDMEPGNLCDPALNRWRTLSNIQWTHASQNVLSNLSSYHSQIAKPCGYSLLLIPLVALCIRFLINALLGKAMKKTKGRVTNKSQAPHCELRTDRRRTILDDDMVSDTPDTISAKDFVGSDPFEEDHSPACSEKMSSEYSELESKYLKFLSDCGISQ